MHLKFTDTETHKEEQKNSDTQTKKNRRVAKQNPIKQAKDQNFTQIDSEHHQKQQNLQTELKIKHKPNRGLL